MSIIDFIHILSIIRLKSFTTNKCISFKVSADPASSSQVSTSSSSSGGGFGKTSAHSSAQTVTTSGSGNTADKELTDPDEALTHIELLAKNVPALMHIKCAFCAYECLIFRNSVLNTLYKSPFEEHMEKSFATCPMFREQFMFANNKSGGGSSNSTSGKMLDTSNAVTSNKLTGKHIIWMIFFGTPKNA